MKKDLLLAIDVGNTNMVVGVYKAKKLLKHWRLETKKGRTDDEIGVLIKELLKFSDIPEDRFEGVIISNVVPPLKFALDSMSKKYFGADPLTVGPGMKIPMKVLYYDLKEVGADRIVNAIAAYDKYKKALIVVDFGTATTFDYITPKGEYVGGAIAPGIVISNDALAYHASRLPRIDIARAKRVIGRTTVESMQSGIYYGYAGLVNEIVNRMKKEVKTDPRVIATGGLAPLIAKGARTIEDVDELLTLKGLRIIWDANHQQNGARHQKTEPGTIF